jgi:hypothetical protein
MIYQSEFKLHPGNSLVFPLVMRIKSIVHIMCLTSGIQSSYQWFHVKPWGFDVYAGRSTNKTGNGGFEIF